MDWNLKAPSWDLTEFEQETIPNIDAISGSSSLGGEGIKGHFSVELKLGQVIDSGNNELGDNLKVPNIPKMALSLSGSSKRARGINNGIHSSCLVDGCTADLRNCREYHRRHKVCEEHSKTPQVTINGRKQRFCQQCSRFHSLEEFDEGKRSCRKRLDGHNRRRRKPQPEPLSHAGGFVSSNQGTRLLAFSSPQVYPATTMGNPIWSGIVKANEDTKLYNQNSHSHLPDKQSPFPESSSCSDRGGSQFSFLHSTNLELSNQTAREASGSGAGNNKMFCDRFSTPVLHSDCALSLLSSPPTRTLGMGLSHMVHPSSIPTTHPLDAGLNYNSLEPIESILVPNAGDANVHSQGMFQMAPRDRYSEGPFYWD